MDHSPSTPPSDSNSSQTPISETEILWNSAGMHRPIASFWYNYIFLLIAAIPAVLVVGYLIPSVLMPYPSALGMASVVTSYFSLMFTLFDIGTGQALERFIAEHAVKNPKRTLQYMQFFTWFQLFTGLMQTTIVAIYAIFAFRTGDQGFLVWPFLIYSLTQYPGMLRLYSHALGAYQRHDKQIIVDLFQNVLMQSLTQIMFIILGRYYGSQDPAIGELMGAVFGYIIGSYIDDFIGMLLGGYFFHKTVQSLGFSVWDTITPGFSKDVAKEVMIYGLKVVPAYAVDAGIQFLILLMTMAWLPNYTSIIAIVGLAEGVAMVTSVSFTITPAISESYNNGYEHLCQYYIRQQWKHWSLIAMFLFVEVYLIVRPAFRVLAGEYSLAADLLPLLLFTRLLVFPINFGSAVAQGINHPEYHTYALIFEQSTMGLTFFLFLNPWFGLMTVLDSKYYLIVYVFAKVPGFCVKLITQWGFVKKHIKFSIAPPFYQTFIAPILTMIPLILITEIPLYFFNQAVRTSGGNLLIPIIILAITLLIALFLFPIFILFPVYGFVGGWDDAGLEAFRKAALISGPSGVLVKIMAKFTTWTHNHSPVKNRFAVDYSKAAPEAERLSQQRIALYLKDKSAKTQEK